MASCIKKHILLIAPQYPPAINGLGDYAALLGQGLTNAGYTVHFAGLPQPTPVTVQPY
jgi:folate-dependent phosphoribosylglycinamide formyltransferase PurN